MKNILKIISISTIMLLTIVFISKPISVTEVKATSETLEDKSYHEIKESFYELEDTTNDPNNQIINIPISSLPTTLTNNMNQLFSERIEQKAFEYHFENYVKLQVNFYGGDDAKITLTFDTYSWSKSEYFNVNMYTTSGTLKASKPIWKSYGNPASVYFYLPKGNTYYFNFENSNYGQKIDGVGYWTLEP